ncbi:MAG: alcohol dehydrogenase catalytic domain-containing protein [Desulfobacterales bacterium]|jgi:L-iditol 2-dehydrogenase
MKALVYTKPDEVVYRDEPEPVPGEGQVLVKVAASGICGSDMHAYHGHDSRRVPPLILGHEVAGTVASGKRQGERVVINPLMTCGICPHCESGRTNLCPTRELIGMRVAGAYSDYVAISEQNLIPIPDSFDMVKASLAEPAACALHSLSRAQMLSPRPLAELRTLVIGGGAIGMLSALLLANYGCRSVTVAETNQLRRETVADTVGCAIHDPLSDPEIPADSFDLVIDAVGGGVTRSMGSRAVAPGGIFVHIGLMDSKEGLDIRKITLQEVSLAGIYTYTRQDFRATVDALASGMFGSLEWVETRPLADGAHAFDDLDKGRIRAAKLVLVP